MTALLLAEGILLLAHNEESGKPNGTLALDNGLAGALLLDLTAEELVAADGKALSALVGAPSHPLLASSHAKLLQSDEPVPAPTSCDSYRAGSRSRAALASTPQSRLCWMTSG